MNIQEIAQRADSLARSEYNKSAIWQVFQDALLSDGKLTTADMAKLYKYFAPKMPAKPKTAEQWVAQAMADRNEVRYYLQYIYSDGSRIMATDGHRMHIVTTSQYPEGFYDAQMNPVHVDAQFPDVDRVIPDSTKLIKRIAYSEVETDDIGTDKPQPVVRFNGVCIDAGYMKKAAQFFDDPVIQYTDKLSPVKIEDGDNLAVIMPMRA